MEEVLLKGEIRMKQEKTQIQKTIENIVTSGRGFDRHFDVPNELRRSDLGVQMALGKMESRKDSEIAKGMIEYAAHELAESRHRIDIFNFAAGEFAKYPDGVPYEARVMRFLDMVESDSGPFSGYKFSQNCTCSFCAEIYPKYLVPGPGVQICGKCTDIVHEKVESLRKSDKFAREFDSSFGKSLSKLSRQLLGVGYENGRLISDLPCSFCGATSPSYLTEGPGIINICDKCSDYAYGAIQSAKVKFPEILNR